LVVDDDTHSLSTQHIRRAYQYRVAYFIGYFHSLVCSVGSTVFWIRDIQFFEQIRESTSILCNIHIIERGTNYSDSLFMQALSHFKGCLSTQLNDNAFRFFMLNDFPNMLPVNRFKIQLISDIEVGRNGFRVTVNHDCFIATFFNGEQTMGTAVVKLNTLSDSVGTRTQNYYFLFISNYRFILESLVFNRSLFKSTVEVRCFCFELGATGIYHFVHAANA